MSSRRLKVGALAILLATSCTGLAGCASSQAARVEKPDFTGGWSVKWCDRTHPELECGGFDVTLVQEGDRVCGDFGSALVNLRQTDEGSVVGTAVGNTAILAVESYRNGSIALVRATLKGSELHWKEVDNIRRGGSDIAIIATDDVLVKSRDTSSQPAENQREKATCKSILGRKES
ncbi:hypothetical protein J2X02_002647 [Pseudoxanthomonas japonensis]|uniref:hypothetical protein n=1 Tax=Pseudoxanthomonas japonensis TaxID=69284 RepID=UPI002864DEFC|nr:hypothetical protein [Pseudoxanthomonas japonensis]MDR7069796.1 hypothetical protein [Pseudoxanthomonas japonensis]